MHLHAMRVCVKRNPSALHSPIPVCLPRAKSSIPLGLFFFVCWFHSGNIPTPVCFYSGNELLFCTVPGV